MAVNQAARAQTAQTLDQVARALKRQIRESRELLGLVRRAEVTLLGIEVQDMEPGPDPQDDEPATDGRSVLAREADTRVRAVTDRLVSDALHRHERAHNPTQPSQGGHSAATPEAGRIRHDRDQHGD